jgi:adenylate kinase
LSSDEGILFDGFPRSVDQAKLLDELFNKLGKNLDCVINLELDDRVVVERINGRRLCPNCGKSYHVKFNPPKTINTCDGCGSELVIREDDNEESIKGRLKTYYAQTFPLINYYKEQGKLISIDATQDIESIARNIDDILGGLQ